MIDTPQDTLRVLNIIAPGSVLAGGFLRDEAFGVPPKDLDYFSPSTLTLGALQTVFPAAKREPYSTFLEYTNEEVKAVYNIGTVAGFPAQVIALEEGIDPASRIVRFDFGFCQVGMFEDGGRLYSDAFKADQVNNTATLVHCESANEFTRSMKRWARLQRKYPDRLLVIPEEFQKWMQLPA